MSAFNRDDVVDISNPAAGSRPGGWDREGKVVSGRLQFQPERMLFCPTLLYACKSIIGNALFIVLRFAYAHQRRAGSG